MRLEIEVWLRGNDFATTDVVDVPVTDASAWTDADVSVVLKELLRSIDRASNPEADRQRPVALRGFNWIVSAFEGGGFTIAVEIQLGAAAAGPFPLAQAQLEAMITRVVAGDRVGSVAASPSVH
jgi:hypothetical protein